MNCGLPQRAVEAVHGQGRRVTVVWGRLITSEPSTENSGMAQPWAAGTGHSSHTWNHTCPFLTHLARYFPPFHMYSMATAYSSSFTLRTNKRKWMTPKLSWRFSPFCDCFFTWQRPREDASSVAALRPLTSQKASCSLYAQASSRNAPTLHGLCTRRVGVEGAVHCFYSVCLWVLKIIHTVLILAQIISRTWMPHQTPASTDSTLQRSNSTHSCWRCSPFSTQGSSCVKSSSPESCVGWGSLFNE